MNFPGRLLEAFLVLEETRRFNVAADRCHVSPSAFSQMIGRLERQVGARLFDRNTRQVTLTPEGEVFAVGARRIVAEIAASVGEVRDRAALKTGSVSIAAPASLSSDWLPALLAAFRRENPSIVLKLRDVVSDRCLELVHQGQADFGLNGQPGNQMEFDSSLRFAEVFHLICRSDDPLARLASLRLRQLKGRDFIRTASVWRQLQTDLLRAGVRDTGLEVEQFGTVAGLVAHGFGVSLIPQFALPMCGRPGLASVPVADRGVVRPLYMVRRRGRSLSLAAQALWDFVARLSGPDAGGSRAGQSTEMPAARVVVP